VKKALKVGGAFLLGAVIFHGFLWLGGVDVWPIQRGPEAVACAIVTVICGVVVVFIADMNFWS